MTRQSKLTGAAEKAEDITICIHTFDRAKFITACLDQLEYQEVNKLKVLIVDSGSQDGTPELIETQIKNGWWKPPTFRPELDIELVRLPEVKGKAAGVVRAMEEFQSRVTTKYLLRVEADILLPPNAIKPLIAEMKANKNLGMLAIPYFPSKGHVPTDCTIFRTEDVKALVWQWDKNGCDCLHALNQFTGLSKVCKFHGSLVCRHLKFL